GHDRVEIDGLRVGLFRRAALGDEGNRARLQIGLVEHLADRSDGAFPEICQADRVRADEPDPLALGQPPQFVLRRDTIIPSSAYPDDRTMTAFTCPGL